MATAMFHNKDLKEIIFDSRADVMHNALLNIKLHIVWLREQKALRARRTTHHTMRCRRADNNL
jgi:hypothetical protein